MLTLAIETSGMAGTIALCREGACLEERPLTLDRRHAQTLVPEIHALFESAGHSVRHCGLVGVSIGPGSFTGIRVGIVCAKMLAYALKCPLVGIETLTAIASGAPREVDRLQVVMDAQRQDLFRGTFVRDSVGTWQRSGQVEIVAASDWLGTLSPDDVVTGPGLDPCEPEAAARARVLPRELWLPRAKQVASLAVAEAAAGRVADPLTLVPLYLRRSAAEEQWDARLRRASLPSSPAS